MVGDWAVSTDIPKTWFAIVANDSDDLFGEYCDPRPEGACQWLLVMPLPCETGSKAPAIANSDAGAESFTVQCLGPNSAGKYRYAFSPFDQMEDLIKRSSRIGLAFPLEQDQFRVVRFQMSGSSVALATMKKGAAKLLPPQASTADQTL